MRKGKYPATWIPADYGLPAGVDIKRRITNYLSQQLPSVEV